MLRLVKILFFISLFLTCNTSYSEDLFVENETNEIDSILSALKQSQNEKEIIESLSYLSSLFAGNENFDSAHLIIDSAIIIAKKHYI